MTPGSLTWFRTICHHKSFKYVFCTSIKKENNYFVLIFFFQKKKNKKSYKEHSQNCIWKTYANKLEQNEAKEDPALPISWTPKYITKRAIEF